jgi:putative sterol carrier protein
VPDLFSPHGIATWRARLEDSESFRAAARGWSGTVLLVADDPGASAATYLRVEDGRLIAARPAEAVDREAAEFVLRADRATWEALADGRAELVSSALTGRLHLDRGAVHRLVPHARAASAMLRAGTEE